MVSCICTRSSVSSMHLGFGFRGFGIWGLGFGVCVSGGNCYRCGVGFMGLGFRAGVRALEFRVRVQGLGITLGCATASSDTSRRRRALPGPEEVI